MEAAFTACTRKTRGCAALSRTQSAARGATQHTGATAADIWSKTLYCALAAKAYLTRLKAAAQ